MQMSYAKSSYAHYLILFPLQLTAYANVGKKDLAKVNEKSSYTHYFSFFFLQLQTEIDAKKPIKS